MSDNSETKWEYCLLASAGLIDNQSLRNNIPMVSIDLLELGEDGWELVGFENGFGWFKRRKASKDGAQLLFEE